jgi:hypothetical protein
MKQDTFVIDIKTVVNLKTGAEKLALAGNMVAILAAFGLFICLNLVGDDFVSAFFQMLAFLFAGIFQVRIMRRSLPFVSFAGEWIYTLLTTGLVVLLFGCSAFWGLQFSVHLAVACISAFLLPFFLSEVWRAKLQLSYEGIKIWYPTHEPEAQYPQFYFNSSPMRFRIIQGKGAPNVAINFKVSNEMTLGKIFYDLAHNKNMSDAEIALANALKKPYSWIFFTPDWLVLNRALDPEETLSGNGLKENALIYAQRVFQEDLTVLTEYLP